MMRATRQRHTGTVFFGKTTVPGTGIAGLLGTWYYRYQFYRVATVPGVDLSLATRGSTRYPGAGRASREKYRTRYQAETFWEYQNLGTCSTLIWKVAKTLVPVLPKPKTFLSDTFSLLLLRRSSLPGTRESYMYLVRRTGT